MVENAPSLTHANRHAAGGPDALTPAAIGAATTAQAWQSRPWKQFVPNEWRLNYRQANGGNNYVSGLMILALTYIPFNFTLDGLGCLVAGAPGAGTVRTVLFSDSITGPNVGVADTGPVLATSNGIKSAIGLAVTGNRGLYWAGVLAENVTGTLGIETSNNNYVLPWATMPYGSGTAPAVSAGNDGTVAQATGISGSQVGAEFTGSLRGDSNTPGQVPAIWFRFSAITY